MYDKKYKQMSAMFSLFSISTGIYILDLPEKNILCPNLINLNRGLNLPKTGFNWAPA